MMVLNTEGRILYLSDSAKSLLNLAIYPLAELKKCNEIALLEKLKQLCRNLKTIYHGQPAAPPTFCHLNARGRFIFNAYWLKGQNQALDGLIGIAIEHQEPQAIKVLRALQFAPLSPTQKQVAALLANNLSYEQVCAKLHIKLTTLKDHIRTIYQRLDIHKHEQLLPKLLEMDNSHNKHGGVLH
jgi:DNA-binding CsgD family transcriptional regulator